MVFASCSNPMDTVLGYVLVALAFIMSMFQVQAHGQLSDADKAKNSNQYTLAMTVLIVCILYAIYAFWDPIMSMFGKAKQGATAARNSMRTTSV